MFRRIFDSIHETRRLSTETIRFPCPRCHKHISWSTQSMHKDFFNDFLFIENQPLEIIFKFPKLKLISVRIHSERMQHNFVFAQEIPPSSIYIDNWLAGRCLWFTNGEWFTSWWFHCRLLGNNAQLRSWWICWGYKENRWYGTLYRTSFT